MRNGLQLCGLRVAGKAAQFPTRAHSGTGFHECIGGLGIQFPKLTRGFTEMALTGNLTGVLHGRISWFGLKFSIHAAACLHLFKGQKLNKLQSMPDKIHTHRRISNIPNKLLLAWLYFEATSFHSSAVSFHSLFLPLECFCKAAYKLLALNKKMLGFLFVIRMGFFLNLLQQQLQGLYFHQDSPWELKPQSNKREQKTERTEKSPTSLWGDRVISLSAFGFYVSQRWFRMFWDCPMQEVVVIVLQRLFCQLHSCLKIGFYFIRCFNSEKGLLFYHYIACVQPVWFILLWHSFCALIKVFS